MDNEFSTKNDENKVITFGCRLNLFESEQIKKALKQANQKKLIVFNSCAVTEKAEKDLISAIKKTKKENPAAKIVITGCAAQINSAKYAAMSQVDLVVGNAYKSNAESYNFNFDKNLERESESEKNNCQKSLSNSQEKNFEANSVKENQQNLEKNHKDKIFFETKKSSVPFLSPQETAKIRVNDIMSVRDTAPQLASFFENQTRAFLEIQNGCDHRCTFCIIPYGRGNSRSVAFGEIVSQSKKMVEAGHQEIVLTGVDISGYGNDLAVKISLSQMIKRLLKLVPELKRLRLSSVDVAELMNDEDFFDLLASEERFMPYLHLSVQSGDDVILKRMKRRHNRRQVLDFCEKVRKIRPETTFGADIIAGFPTENEEAFNNSVNLIKEAGIIFNHIFPYSKREGTPAAKMNQIDKKIIKERAKILREVGKSEFEKFVKKQINRKFKVLVEKNCFGKTENFLDVKISDSKNFKIGEIYEVNISDFDQKNLNLIS
jgi:threonylcarbamoyladenosine tRNA methylthiotransferase MtaB